MRGRRGDDSQETASLKHRRIETHTNTPTPRLRQHTQDLPRLEPDTIPALERGSGPKV